MGIDGWVGDWVDEEGGRSIVFSGITLMKCGVLLDDSRR